MLYFPHNQFWPSQKKASRQYYNIKTAYFWDNDVYSGRQSPALWRFLLRMQGRRFHNKVHSRNIYVCQYLKSHVVQQTIWWRVNHLENPQARLWSTESLWEVQKILVFLQWGIRSKWYRFILQFSVSNARIWISLKFISPPGLASCKQILLLKYFYSQTLSHLKSLHSIRCSSNSMLEKTIC